MTALSGTAGSYASLAAYRIGVGIGEASASPAAFSMLSDYYPPALRATAIAIYSSGIYIGGGIGLFLGDFIMESWNDHYANATSVLFGLKGWQAAFLAVGIPGILMAAWVRTLREPTRGISEGLVTAEHTSPFRVLTTELMSVLPILNLPGLRAVGASLRVNAITAAAIGLAGYGLYLLTGSIAQWFALSNGAYVVFFLGPVTHETRLCHVRDDLSVQSDALYDDRIPDDVVHRLRHRLLDPAFSHAIA